jgi:hypothetical protein
VALLGPREGKLALAFYPRTDSGIDPGHAEAAALGEGFRAQSRWKARSRAGGSDPQARTPARLPGMFTAEAYTSGVVEPPVGMGQVDRCPTLNVGELD